MPVDTVERVVVTVGATHQMDDLISTQWDTTRCQAASAVAIAAVSGPMFVDGLANHVVLDFERRIATLWQVVQDLGSGDDRVRVRGLTAFLPELQRHASAFRLSMGTALAELGYDPSDKAGIGLGVPGHMRDAPLVLSDGKRTVSIAAPNPMSTGVMVDHAATATGERKWFVRNGVGPELAEKVNVPAIQRTIMWTRLVANDQGVEDRVALQTKEIEVADAGLLLAVHQLTGDELALVERVLSCLEAELDKARSTLKSLRSGSRTRDPRFLQQLADSVLVAQQRSAHGLNAAEISQALRSSGFAVESIDKAVAWKDLARAVKPGEFLLLEGIGHAITFGRLHDGRTFVYDPEGTCGDRQRPCMTFTQPGRDAEIDQHYGKFQATHTIRQPRLLDIYARR